jgi:predicted DCC family thiol-disulfide oxidoreductase YuxK
VTESSDLRAAVHAALTSTPASFAADRARPFDTHGTEHHYDGTCALCRGEADTLTDAVMAVLERSLPGRIKAPALTDEEWAKLIAESDTGRLMIMPAFREPAQIELEQLTARLDALRALPERLRVMAAASGPNPDARRAALREAALLIDTALIDTAPLPPAEPDDESETPR